MTIWDNESARRTVRYNLPCHDQRPFQVAAIQAAGLIDFVPGNGGGSDDGFTILEHPPLPLGKTVV
jgi:hypothetical protein